ncbi:uncharacterized protein UTRI_00792 [Ustilago trichophora]|uniref:C2H2-type domain-containing protein n=1 Tax=Ustilago trichophora TaxID=86804 RepID=A0A5C3DSH6_9BASI|nr:uncharacterized protein UTRI_00792 [Ustilago trichophora]
MDRNGALWLGSGDRVDATLDGLPARSSSASPNRPDGLVRIEEAETTLVAAGAPSSNFSFAHTSEWVESHYPYDHISASPAAQDRPLFPGLSSQNGHQPSLGESPNEAMQAMTHDSQSHSMRSLIGMTLTTTSGLASDNRFRNTGFPEAIPSYSFPVCPLPSNNGHIGPTRTANFPLSSEELRLGEHRHFRYREDCAGVPDEGLDVRQQSMASRVRALELSSPPPLVPFPMHHGLGVIEDDALVKVATRQDWMHAASGEHNANSMSRLPYLGEALRSDLLGGTALPFESNQDRNPMWGPAEHHANAEFGNDHNDFYGIGLHGLDHSTTTGGTSSLASSRSLPELTWSSTDPWLNRACSEFLPDEDEGGALAKGESTTTNRAAVGCMTYSASATSTGCASANPRASLEEVANHRDSRPILSAESHVMGGRAGGNRMEEGEIGSKRRIWYRAPNGQFASATQALSGQLPGDGNGNGEGSSRGSEGGIRRIRRRRKSEEVERKYRCDFDGCNKAYGTLNHLNTHRATNEHGPRLNAVESNTVILSWNARTQATDGHMRIG